MDQASNAIPSISIFPLARKSMPLEERCRLISTFFALFALFFLVFLVQRTTSFLPSIRRISPLSTRDISMGLTESLFQKDTSEKKKSNRPTKEHPIDPQIRERWKRMCNEFEDAVLDPAYLHLPIRASTVNASLLYKSDFPKRPGMMPGTHKHLGGAYDPSDGSIYGVPANSRAIMCIYPNKDKGGEYQLTTIPLPESIQKQKMKWLRGIISNGYLWAIPAWADSVLCVDLDAFWGRRPLPEGQKDVVTLIPLPESHPKGMRWQWHGAGINHAKTAIYCVPSNAKNVLKVDVLTKTTSFIEIEYDAAKYPEFSLDCPNKWYGGITGDDGCVYGVPYRSSSVLRIDPSNDTATLIGPNYGIAKYFWHGGILRHGKIYAHPSHSASVLVIDTRKENSGAISELPIHRASYDVDKTTNYKWLGGAVGADGNIYCPSCDSSSILKINVTTDRCETFGYAGDSKNKAQGAIYSPRDKCLYCIPADGTQICRISTDFSIEGENAVQLIGNLPAQGDKFQGAHMGLDGSLYFIPENSYRVLRLTPPDKPPVVLNGKWPEGDVKIELM